MEEEKVICYLKGCELSAFPGSYWCTRTHQIEEQEYRYGHTSTNKKPITIDEIQKRLKIMGKEAANRPKVSA